jgi:hypothetical protein
VTFLLWDSDYWLRENLVSSSGASPATSKTL